MLKSSVSALRLALAMFPLAVSAFAQSNAQVQRVVLLPTTKDVEIEIRATHRITPQTQVIAGPDRLILDFAGAAPGGQLRTLTVNRGGVKAVRTGLFRSNPPITRVVLDLTGPLPYQVFPSGSSVIVKLGQQSAAAGTPAAAPVPDQPPPPPPPVLNVSFQNGVMSVTAERTNLAAVLNEIRRQTNAEIAIPAGAEQEPVIAKVGPGPVRDVVAALLNGSNYNFIIVGTDTSLVRLLLSPKGSGAPYSPPAPAAYNQGPPTRIAPPQPVQPEETAPAEQEIPEQSGDQANDAPQPENQPGPQPGNEPGPQPGPPPQP